MTDDRMLPDTASYDAVAAGIIDRGELEEVFVKLVQSTHYRAYKNREGTLRIDAWNVKDELPWRMRYLANLLQTMCASAQRRSGQRVQPLQVILCCTQSGRRPDLKRKDCHLVSLTIENDPGCHGTLDFTGPPVVQHPIGMPYPVNMASPPVVSPTVSVNLFYQLTPAGVTCAHATLKRPRSPCDVDLSADHHSKRLCARP